MNTGSAARPEIRRRPLKLRVHTALRWIHVYISMFSMLAVLFFSFTGLTLNHPEWTFGQKETRTTRSGTLPRGWRTEKGIDWLLVSEHLRKHEQVHGLVEDRRVDGEGALSFKAPGYAADCTFSLATGQYRVDITQQGIIGVLNDLHKGRDSGGMWSLVIDLSAALLCVVSVTGIALLLYLKKMRASGLAVCTAGCILLWLLIRMVP